jgi:hypothetical protein
VPDAIYITLHHYLVHQQAETSYLHQWDSFWDNESELYLRKPKSETYSLGFLGHHQPIVSELDGNSNYNPCISSDLCI